MDYEFIELISRNISCGSHKIEINGYQCRSWIIGLRIARINK